MIIYELIQGSPEWHEFRANHYGASEAPAMMGKSKYQSRTELIEAKKFGAKEVDPATQRIFDAGHEAEAKAIAIAEEIIGEPLFPVTGSLPGTKLSASFDGLTMDNSIAWEHKLWNIELAKAIEAGELSEHYTIQMDQQMAVSGADRVLFMCSDGTKEYCAWCWYFPPDLSYLEPGWMQFEQDLAVHEHVPEPESIEVKSIDDLPSLRINVTGMVQSSNLKLYEDQATQFIESINTDLKTDDDFANAEKLAKFCKDAEKEIEAAKKAALAQTEDIDQLFQAIDKIKEDMRQKRLQIEKKVKTKKENIKRDILAKSQDKLNEHMMELAVTFGVGIISSTADFAGAMRNKRTLTSLRDACDTELARAKIVANERHALAMQNREAIPDEYKFLFSDFAQIALQDHEQFLTLVESRITIHKQREAERLAEQKRIQEAEAKAKAEREVREKLEAERKKEEAAFRARVENAELEAKSFIAEMNKDSEPTVPPHKQTEAIYPDGVQLLAMYTVGLGFLPMINNADMTELYRGEYQTTAVEAIQKCDNFLRNK